MLRQVYENYTPQDHHVWNLLYQRQMEVLPNRADENFFKGLEMIQFSDKFIPNYDEVNKHLANITGWAIYVVPGLVPDKDFFELLANKKFPCSTWIRKIEQLEYLQEPDMFHDVFGHVPLLTEPSYCEFLSGLARIALKHIDNAWAIELLSRVYWFTIEFGLIKTKKGNRIYGAGILSSPGESIFSLEGLVPEYPFDVSKVYETSYIKSKFQERYFLIDSYEQLYGSLDLIEKELEVKIKDLQLKEEWTASLQS